MYTKDTLLKKHNRSNSIFLLILVVSLCFSYVYFKKAESGYRAITSFEMCIEAGYSIAQGIYPEECVMPGKKFRNTKQVQPSTQIAMTENTFATSTINQNDYRNLTYYAGEDVLYLVNGIGVLKGDPATKRGTTTLVVASSALFLADLNKDSVQDFIFIMQGTTTLNVPVTYLSAAVSLHNGFSGINLVRLPALVASSSFIYKNGGVSLIYTSGTSTQKNEYFFVYNNGMLIEKSNVRK